MPRGGGDPSSRQKEESGGRHTVQASSTNSSSRTCRSRRSLPLMSSRCTCIAEPSSLLWPMKINEQDPDRWCSHSAWGQECWQVVSQWVWNLRLELGHQLEPTPIRTTEFAPALSAQSEQAATRPPHPSRLWVWSTHQPPPPGKRVASREPTFLSSLMGRCAVQQESLFTPRSGVERPMAVCVWCMRPAFAVVARVRCASSVNGMAARPRSRAR